MSVHGDRAADGRGRLARRAGLTALLLLILGAIAPGPASAAAERLAWSSVAVGGGHTCAISATDSALYCWGDNTQGQLGMPSRIPPPAPEGAPAAITPVLAPALVEGAAAGQAFISVAAGGAHTCAVTSAKRLLCWGSNESGQLGIGTVPDPAAGPTYVPTPTPVTEPLADRDVVAVAAGGSTTCALTAEGRVFCWGNNGAGQVGIGAAGPPRPKPTPVSRGDALADVKVTSVTVGDGHACALGSTGVAYCWGNDANGQTGTGKQGAPGQGGQTLLPTPVRTALDAAPTTFTAVSAGSSFTCGISAGAALCWGQMASGRLGNGFTSPDPAPSSFVPIPVDITGELAGRQLVAVSAGSGTACVLDRVGSAVCWGNNSAGQVGNGKSGEGNGLLPTKVVSSRIYPGLGLSSIAVGGNHTCAILDPKAGGQMACWGSNSSGQLGLGSLAAATAASPRAVAAPLPVVEPTPTPSPNPTDDSGGSTDGGSSGLPIPLILGGAVLILVLVVLWLVVRKRGKAAA